MSEVIILLESITHDISASVKQYIKCRQQNLCLQCYAQLHLEVPLMPLHFIAIDLIGNFKALPQGHQYALTTIDIFTNYTSCLLLFTNEGDQVGHPDLVHIYSRFGVSHRILSDSGIEFKNKLFTHIASTLGSKQVFSPPLPLRQYMHWQCTWPFGDVHMEPCILWIVKWFILPVLQIILFQTSILKTVHFFLTFGRGAYTPLV